MAKMLRWERAWQRFTDAFYGIRVRHSSSLQTSRSVYEKHYRQLVGALEAFGIKVRFKEELGILGYPVAGLWNGHKLEIELASQAYDVLAHEFAHAVDYLLSGSQEGCKAELVAATAGYLLTCQNMGMRSPEWDIGYAKSKGATPTDLKNLEGHILRVFREMDSLLTT